MKKKDTKTKELRKFTKDEMEKVLLNDMSVSGDLAANLQKLGETILPEFLDGKATGAHQADDELEKISTEALLALEAKSHLGLMISFNQKYRGMAKELTTQIIAEYDCNTHLEKMQAEIVVNGFVRVLENSKRLNNCFEGGEYISSERTQYLAMLSKQIDRSHRQYLSALMTLKQMKAPTIEMHIKAKTAFVSQNQQINAQTENNEAK
jgi:hypothetical protein